MEWVPATSGFKSKLHVRVLSHVFGWSAWYFFRPCRETGSTDSQMNLPTRWCRVCPSQWRCLIRRAHWWVEILLSFWFGLILRHINPCRLFNAKYSSYISILSNYDLLWITNNLIKNRLHTVSRSNSSFLPMEVLVG